MLTDCNQQLVIGCWHLVTNITIYNKIIALNSWLKTIHRKHLSNFLFLSLFSQFSKHGSLTFSLVVSFSILGDWEVPIHYWVVKRVFVIVLVEPFVLIFFRAFYTRLIICMTNALVTYLPCNSVILVIKWFPKFRILL